MHYHPNQKSKAIGFASILFICSACNPNSEQSSPTATNQLDALDFASVNGGSSTTPQVDYKSLVKSDENTEATTVTTCFCRPFYRSTMQIYHYTDQNSVLIIVFDNQSTEFEPSIELHLFDDTANAESISMWINNQHSDGLFINPPKPAVSVPISKDNISITSKSLREKQPGLPEFASYRLEFTIDNYFEAGIVHLNGFSGATTVFSPVLGLEE